jgi:REP element-mobilizing transposase RayT
VGRPHRIQEAGAIYHVAARGNRGQSVFFDNDDRRRFLRIAGIVFAEEEWICHSVCLLTNHYHLLLTTARANLAKGMHRLNSTYANSFNRRHRKKGHLFEKRYFSGLVETEANFLHAVRYMALNPVRAGICTLPEDWRWSSYRAAVGCAPKPDFLNLDTVLGQFSKDVFTARRELRAFVEEDLESPLDDAALREPAA